MHGAVVVVPTRDQRTKGASCTILRQAPLQAPRRKTTAYLESFKVHHTIHYMLLKTILKK